VVELWPTDTPAKRQMVIIRMITEHIAETEGKGGRLIKLRLGANQ
jgi:hypothetical protein